MNHTQRLFTFVGAALCTLGLFAGQSFAQADFQEGFDNNGPTQEGDDGPINLINKGWIFSNQSEPLGSTDWFDGDGHVGVSDLLILLADWGPCPPKGDCPADLDGDGSVGVADLLILLANWG